MMRRLDVVLVASLGGALLAGTAAYALAQTEQRDDGEAVQAPAVAAPPAGDVAANPAPEATGEQDLGQQVDPSWVRQMSAATGIPAPAVRAYGQASLVVGAETPGCGLGWTTLAGIGHVESEHGTLDGRTLRDDGRSDPRVIGPALDGRGDLAAIRATDRSRQLHGDTTWDHAVGPLQFITSTWQKWAADGDGDGTSDPHDIDDAALAAARYLCADDHRLDGSEWGSAVFSYNHSADYVRLVHSAASTYAQRSLGAT